MPVFSDFYFMAHRAPYDLVEYAHLVTANATLRASVGHYLPVSRGGCDAPPQTLGAGAVVPGDGIWTLAEAGRTLFCARVLTAERALVVGAYNPFTLSGTIVVDGVLASVYAVAPAAWSIERVLRLVLPPDSVARIAPSVYHAAFWPIRALYRAMPLAKYISLVFRLFGRGEAEGFATYTFAELLHNILAALFSLASYGR
jgi:hypothetical protein